MTDVTSQLESYGRDVDRVLTPITLEELDGRRHQDVGVAVGERLLPPWMTAVAVGLATLVLIGGASILFGGSDGSVAPMPPAGPAITVTTLDLSEPSMTPTALMDVTWRLDSTYDDWLEPLAFNGSYFAVRKGLGDDAQEYDEGILEGPISDDGGELWVSEDGVVWEAAAPPLTVPPSINALATDGKTLIVRFGNGDISESKDGNSWEVSPLSIAEFDLLAHSGHSEPIGTQLVVERNPLADLYGAQVTDALKATDDGATWREIVLPPAEDNWVPMVAAGDWGWLVYSPPREATVASDGESMYQGQRRGNLGLWYTPDTHDWNEVTDIGPLVDAPENMIDDGLQVIDVTIVVRDNDALVYARIADNQGFGHFSQLRTEIWQLAPDGRIAPEPVMGEVFDFSTQSLCDWFSPEEIDAIVTSTYKELGVPLDWGDALDRRQDETSDCFWAPPLVWLHHNEEIELRRPFVQHPALNESVRVSIEGDGSFGLMYGIAGVLRIDGHPEQLWFGHATNDNLIGNVEMINTIGLTIANKMLQQMGWIDSD